jgi:OOP family OmpA-OmpF porin
MPDLLRAITGLLTPGVIQRAATLVGESPSDTQRALDTRIVPAVLAGLAALATSDVGAARLRELADRAAERSPLSDLGGLFGGGAATEKALRAGRDQVAVLFGGKRDAIVAELAGASEVQLASASSLLALVTPVVLAVLGNERAALGLDTPGLAHLLVRERAGLGNRLTPALQRLVRDVEPAPASVRPPAGVRRTEATASVWPRVVAVLLPLLLGTWLLFEWAPWRQEPAPARPAKRRLARLPLPSGSALEVPEGSFNHELARYLADPNTTAPRAFVFEDLAFQSGKSALAPESQGTVADLARILQAFPSAEIRLEGHTDDVGEADQNQRLSLERAETVKAALIAAGIAPRRLDALGFGQGRPVAPNDSEDGRAKNRRTELVVTRK